ncbi:MAG: phosphonate metabolism protein/1,5-bisphosphokinase (PRPP-forming) PhnN [Phyllobacterium sp.]
MMAAALIERTMDSIVPHLREGVFVAVVGPSGAGKDTVIDYARKRLHGRSDFHFVRRVVTRPASAGAEDHDSLDEAAFARTVAAGAYALHWDAHGLRYGLPKSVDHEMEAGSVVVANLSRRVVPQLRAAYANVSVVHLSATPDVLAQRLAMRGRETAEAIEQRLRRSVDVKLDDAAMTDIDNSGEAAIAGERFVAHLKKAAAFAAVSGQL